MRENLERNDDTYMSTEAGKLFCEFHKHFLLTKVLKDPVQITVNQNRILTLYAKWKEAIRTEIMEQLLPDLLPLFGNHAHQIVLFNTGDIFNINLALLLTGYSVKAYDVIQTDLYDLIEFYSRPHTCSLSMLTASYPLSERHSVSAGTIIWQRSGG